MLQGFVGQLPELAVMLAGFSWLTQNWVILTGFAGAPRTQGFVSHVPKLAVLTQGFGQG